MNDLVILLQDNAAMTAVVGFIVAVIFQLLKKIPALEPFTGSAAATIWKGRVASFIVSLLATIGASLAADTWTGIGPVLLVALQTWFVSQGAWAGLLRRM